MLFLYLEACWVFCHNAKALWESDSGLGPQRKAKCYFSDLYSKSPLVKYQPKISPTWAFHLPFQTFLMAETLHCLDSLFHWVWDPP